MLSKMCSGVNFVIHAASKNAWEIVTSPQNVSFSKGRLCYYSETQTEAYLPFTFIGLHAAEAVAAFKSPADTDVGTAGVSRAAALAQAPSLCPWAPYESPEAPAIETKFTLGAFSFRPGKNAFSLRTVGWDWKRCKSRKQEEQGRFVSVEAVLPCSSCVLIMSEGYNNNGTVTLPLCSLKQDGPKVSNSRWKTAPDNNSELIPHPTSHVPGRRCLFQVAGCLWRAGYLWHPVPGCSARGDLARTADCQSFLLVLHNNNNTHNQWPFLTLQISDWYFLFFEMITCNADSNFLVAAPLKVSTHSLTFRGVWPVVHCRFSCFFQTDEPSSVVQGQHEAHDDQHQQNESRRNTNDDVAGQTRVTLVKSWRRRVEHLVMLSLMFTCTTKTKRAWNTPKKIGHICLMRKGEWMNKMHVNPFSLFIRPKRNQLNGMSPIL